MPSVVRVWLPWGLVGLAAGAALILLMSAIAAHLQAVGDRQDAERGWAALQTVDGTAVVAAPAAASDPDVPVAPLPVGPAALPAHLQRLADEAGVELLQFVPEAAPGDGARARAGGSAGAPGEPVAGISLQARGGLAAIGRFLHALPRSGLALELSSLRLTAGEGVPGPFCTLALRAHDAASLRTLAMEQGAVPGPDAAPAEWDDIPASAFGPFATVVVAPSARSMDRRRLSVAPGTDSPDPLRGARLTGLLSSGERSAALIRLPGVGTLALRPGDALPGTPLRIGRFGEGWVTLTAASGTAHRLELGVLPTPGRTSGSPSGPEGRRP